MSSNLTNAIALIGLAEIAASRLLAIGCHEPIDGHEDDIAALRAGLQIHRRALEAIAKEGWKERADPSINFNLPRDPTGRIIACITAAVVELQAARYAVDLDRSERGVIDGVRFMLEAASLGIEVAVAPVEWEARWKLTERSAAHTARHSLRFSG